MRSIRNRMAEIPRRANQLACLGTTDHDLGSLDGDAGESADSIEELMHISVQILDSHRPCDVPRSQFRT